MYLSSLKLTLLPTIYYLQAKTNWKCICQCCLADCEREQKDLDTGCIRQTVLCQLLRLCQVINLSRTLCHATPHTKQQIYCLSFDIILRCVVRCDELPVAEVSKRKKRRHEKMGGHTCMFPSCHPLLHRQNQSVVTLRLAWQLPHSP